MLLIRNSRQTREFSIGREHFVTSREPWSADVTTTTNNASRNELYHTILERIIWYKNKYDIRIKTSLKNYLLGRICKCRYVHCYEGGGHVDNQKKYPIG